MVIACGASAPAKHEGNPIDLIFLSLGPDDTSTVSLPSTSFPHQAVWKAQIYADIKTTAATETTKGIISTGTPDSSESTEATLPTGYNWTLPKDGVFVADRDRQILTITINRFSQNTPILDEKVKPLLFYHFCNLKYLNMPYSELRHIEVRS